MTARLSEEEISELEEKWKLYGGEAECCCHGKLPRLLAELRAVRQERDELQATLDLEWAANRRGIEAWQAATGKTMTWPDQAELVAFVLKERDEARRSIEDRLATSDLVSGQRHAMEMGVLRKRVAAADQECEGLYAQVAAMRAELAEARELIKKVLATREEDMDGLWCVLLDDSSPRRGSELLEALRKQAGETRP